MELIQVIFSWPISIVTAVVIAVIGYKVGRFSVRVRLVKGIWATLGEK